MGGRYRDGDGILWIIRVTGLTHPTGGRTGFNAIYVAQNIGVAVGPLLAGLLAKQGMSHVYIGSFVFAIAFAGYFSSFSTKLTGNRSG